MGGEGGCLECVYAGCRDAVEEARVGGATSTSRLRGSSSREVAGRAGAGAAGRVEG